MARPGSLRRWSLALAALALVVGVPRAVAAVPAHPTTTPLDTLLARVRSSDGVAFSGYAESVGRLPLPDFGPFDEISDLLGDRSRLRVWWQSPTRHRVDILTAGGERDAYAGTSGSLAWDSGQRRLRVVRGGVGTIRVPAGEDLLPTTLGRRLLDGARREEVRLTGSERVAGRATTTVRVTPQDPRTLVRRIDLAVDPATGLVLRVAVTARGQDRPTVDTRQYDLDLAAPPADVLDFRTPPDAAVERVTAVDVNDLADKVVPAVLPDALAGLRRRTAPGVGGVTTYGEGYAQLAVVPLRGDTERGLERRFLVPGAAAFDEDWGKGLLISEPLLTGLLGSRGFRGFVVVGTVTPQVLRSAARELSLTRLRRAGR